MDAQIGHNLPPSDLEIVAERLADKEKAIRDSMEKLIAPESIADEKAAGIATDDVKQIASLVKKVEEAHSSVKKPYLDCGRACDAWKNVLVKDLAEIRAAYETPLNAYLEKRAAEERARQLEAARIERERAEELTAEAQAHAEAGISETAEELLDAALGSEIMADRIEDNVCTAKPSQLAKTRSVCGASASQKLVWVGEIENIAAINLNLLRDSFTLDALQIAVNTFVRNGGRELEGVKISQKTKLSVR